MASNFGNLLESSQFLGGTKDPSSSWLSNFYDAAKNVSSSTLEESHTLLGNISAKLRDQGVKVKNASEFALTAGSRLKWFVVLSILAGL
jgi:hypothetical protein